MADQLYYDNGYADVGYTQRVIDADAINIASAASTSVTATVIFSGASNPSAEFTTTATGGYLHLLGSNDFTWDEQTANWDDWLGEFWEPNKFYLPMVFTQAATGDLFIASGATEISSAFALNADAIILIEGSVNINSAFTVDNVDTRVDKFAESTIQSEFTVVADGSPYDFAQADISSSFTTVASAVVTLSAVSNIQSSFTTVVTPSLFYDEVVDIDTEFTVSPLGGIYQVAVPHAIASEFTTSTLGGVIRRADADIDAVFDLSPTGNIIYIGVSNIDAVFDLDTLTTVKSFNSSNISSEFTTVAVGNTVIEGSVTIGSVFALTATGGYQFVVPLIRRLTIPSETRTGTILPESAVFTMKNETRINIVSANT